jgi:DNA-binding response OmpR family regulator
MRILIVEDEIGIATFLKQGLEEEGYTIIICHDGNKGYELATNEHFDLIILDWMLPGKSGLEICESFRERDEATPILFLTAKDTIEETVLALKKGANDFIRKPFHFEELVERIRIHFRSKNQNKDLHLGSISLAQKKHTVTKNGKVINLTQKEFALLELLILNKDSVCTRKEIIEKVWDIHFDYNTSVIDVFINALRKKLELTEEENYIQTVRGVGYIAKEI